MPITLTVNSVPYEYPIPGDSPGWGQPATDWAEQVTNVLNDLQGPNDIPETSFPIANNVTSFTDVANLSFNTGEVRSAIISYSIYRTSTGSPSGNAESGQMSIVYDNLASPGSKWSLTGYGLNGISGVTFTITDLGQIQYKSTNIGATGYSGVMHFRAKSLAQ